MTSPQSAPGWYPDPSGAPGQQYWDGQQWQAAPQAAPPVPAPYGGQGYGVDQYGRPLSDKSKLVAGLLQIFLGGFGVGRFYLGYNNIGVLQIVATVVTCGVGALWGFVDGIIIVAGNVPDAQGRTLRD
ncbi:NINE protein [Mycobacterium sp.]|uniref:NINE protein n=1 Tax=Mycobacterium sp. TaxID=1785 RepID=UPI003C790F73